MYDAVRIEDLNRPTVALCQETFLADARSAASGKGMPGLRVVTETIPCEEHRMETVEPRMDEVIGDIIAALTKPVTEEEQSPRPEIAEPSRIVFKGELEEVNRFFYKRGWTDGLPIVPPSEQAVAEMLTGTDLPPDHLVAKIIPRMGKATVEKIAINAVMAGALPTHLPVLIAAVQAIMDPEAFFGLYEVSTGSFAPLLALNGPIRRDLNVNCGTGTLSPGNIANAAIGRAISLIIKNIGGARVGIEDMGVHGNPAKYAMVIAENEEESPWEPLHHDREFKGDSTVSVACPRGFFTQMAYGHTPKDLLDTVMYSVPPGRPGTLWVLLPAAHARMFSENGWTKQDVKAFIAQNSYCPRYKYNFIFSEWEPKSRYPSNDMDPVKLFNSPDDVTVYVSGGEGNFIGLLLAATPWKRPRSVMKKIELPANWEALVRKYRDVVPRHIMY